MKKKMVVLLLFATMLMAGCDKQAQGEESSVVSETEANSQNDAKDDSQNSGTNEASDASQAGENSETSQNGGFLENLDTSILYSGGSPWTDTSIIGNITDNMEVSEKDDFYLYANYDWLKNTKIPDGFSAWDQIKAGQITTNDRILEAIANTDSDSPESRAVRDLYAAMTDWDARNEVGVAPFAKLVEEIQSIKSLEELNDYICNPDAPYGVYRFINFENMPDDVGLKYMVKLSCPSYLLGIADEYTSRSEVGTRYYDAGQILAKKMLTRVGFTEEEAMQMFEDSVAFEGGMCSKVSQIGGTVPAYSTPLKSNLKKSVKLFPIERLMETFGYENAKQFREEGVESFYVDELGNNYTQEQLENLKNLMIIKASHTYAELLDQEAYDAWLEYLCAISGGGKEIVADLTTTDVFKDALKEPLLKVCLEYKDCKEMRERVEGMTQKIIEEYETMLRDEDWISDLTKQGAIDKLKNLKIYAIYTDDYKWPDFSELDLKDLSYVDALKKAKDFTRKANSLHTGEYVDESVWMEDTYIPNAYYIPQKNAIKINWGIMSNEVYQDGMSDEELYAGLGTVIGHEISHAFDQIGADYDKDGRMAVWWQIDDTMTFLDRTQKLKDYYASMTVWKGAFVSPFVVTEAMSDMGGMKVILKMAEKHGDFDYDKFFRAYAIHWRRLTIAENEETLYKFDSHPLNFMRCNSVLQQFEKFYETYDIKEGDNMYLAPEDRVLVW